MSEEIVFEVRASFDAKTFKMEVKYPFDGTFKCLEKQQEKLIKMLKDMNININDIKKFHYRNSELVAIWG